MKKKILIIFLSIILLIFAYFSFVFVEYIQRQKENLSMIEYCSQNDTDDCYARMFELLLPKLLLYNAKVDNKDIKLIWFDPDTVRIDAVDAIEKSDALLGYGVYHTTEYEDKYSELYNKNSYAFDCGVPSFKPNNPRCFFYSECLASDDFLIWDILFTRKMQTSSGNIHTLRQKIEKLGLENKKVFVKIDVDEADIAVLPEIIKNYKNITGFNIAFHVRNSSAILERLPILDKLNERFVLVSRHTISHFHNHSSRIINSKYYNGVINSRLIYLSYINKELLENYWISPVQNTDKYYRKKMLNLSNMYENSEKIIPFGNIHYIVHTVERVKNIFKNWRIYI